MYSSSLKFLNNRFILVIILFFLFASIFSLQKESLKYSEPFFLIGFRMTIAGVIILLFNIKSLKLINFKNLKYFLYLSIFNIYLNSIFEIWGLNNMSSSKACMIYSLSPFITSLAAFFLLGEKLNIKKFIGMLIGFLGLIPLTYFRTYKEINSGNLFIFSLSELSLMLSVVFSVFGWIYLKKIISLGYNSFLANSFSMFLGGLLILLHSFVFGESWNPIPVINLKKFLFYTIITCFISNIICYNLFGYLLKFFSTTFMTFSGLMTPFFASFFGYIFLKENLSFVFIISLLLFLLGLIIFYNEEISKNKFIYK